MAEIFDVVNDADEVVGRASREQVHGNPELTHRVAHVLVFNSAGSLFLQLRSPTKDVQPNRWDTSVGGHVDAGETYEQAARREMREELGIDDAEIEPLYRYLHRNEYESEMVATFRAVWDGAVRIDRSEITEGRFWSLAEIAGHPPETYTPNFLDELSRYQRWLDAPADAGKQTGP